jgi:hypothetical protein
VCLHACVSARVCVCVCVCVCLHACVSVYIFVCVCVHLAVRSIIVLQNPRRLWQRKRHVNFRKIGAVEGSRLHLNLHLLLWYCECMCVCVCRCMCVYVCGCMNLRVYVYVCFCAQLYLHGRRYLVVCILMCPSSLWLNLTLLQFGIRKLRLCRLSKL